MATRKNETTISDVLELTKVNLQLFAEGEEEGEANDGQTGVVDQQEETDESNDYFDFGGTDDEEEITPYKKPMKIKEPEEKDESTEEDFEEGSKEDELADHPQKMTPEQNKAYQKIRQKAEAEARAAVEKDKAAVEAQRKYLQEQVETMQQKEVEQNHINAITDDKIDALAYEKGYSYEAAKEILMRDARLAAGLELTQRKQQAEINRMKLDQLRNEKYYSALEPQLKELVKQDPNVDVNGAYTFLLGEHLRTGKLDDMFRDERSKTQQRTLADVQDRSRRRSMSGGEAASGDFNPNTYLSKEDMKLASAWGTDKRELASYKRQQETNSRKRR